MIKFDYVLESGCYLGICAGAYFASGEIEFEKGGHLEVRGKRYLQFFPGVAVGPAFGNNKYCYTSNKGVEAALINWKDSFHSYIYFNGGCYFLNAEKYPTVSVLSHYTEIEGMPPAIISCKVAKGKALLSGIHFEYAAEDLTRDDPFHDAIYPFLNRTEEKRNKIFREILVACGIQQKKRDK